MEMIVNKLKKSLSVLKANAVAKKVGARHRVAESQLRTVPSWPSPFWRAALQCRFSPAKFISPHPVSLTEKKTK